MKKANFHLSRKNVIILLLASAAVIIAGFLILNSLADNSSRQNTNSQQEPEIDQNQLKADQEVSAKASNFAKIEDLDKICEIAGDDLLGDIAGSGKYEKARLPVLTTAEYAAANCEYKRSGTTISLVFYKYTDEKLASANKDKHAAEIIIPDPASQRPKPVPRQSAASVKGSFVISSAVAVDGEYSPAASEKLLSEVMKKL